MKILYGPPGDSSLTTWFKHLDDTPETSSRTLWITPTQGKREWVNAQFRTQQRMFMPRIHTFDEMSRMLYELRGGQNRVIDPVTMQFIMLSILRDPTLEPLIKEWFTSLPGPGFLQEITGQIDELQRHGSGTDHLAAIPDAMDDFGELFQNLYGHYQEYLRGNNLIDIGSLQLELNEMLGVESDITYPWKRCVLDGFLELTPLQMNILQHLDRKLDITLVWPGLPSQEGMFGWMIAGLKTYFPHAKWSPVVEDQTQTHALAGIAMHLVKLRPEGLPEEINGTDDANILRVIAGDTINDEVIRIARDIKTRKAQPGDIAVTFPDLRTYAPLVRRIFHRYGIPVNVSQSLPLTGSPVYISLERLLRLPHQWLRNDVLAVLGDPLLTPWQGEKSRLITRKLLEISSRHKIVRGFQQWQNGLDREQERLHEGHGDIDIILTIRETMNRLKNILENPDDSNGSSKTFPQWILWIRSVLTHRSKHA